jgi:phosphomannomutase
MSELAASGFTPVVGYEANGGFLLFSDAAVSNCSLASLPTRDAVIVHLALLALAKERRLSVSKLIAELPERFTESGRIKDYPTEKSKLLLADLSQGGFSRAQEIFLSLAGKIQSVDQTDGLRLVFDNDSIIHLRPSGNAPEFRCYAESTTAEEAASLVKETLSILRDYAL